MDNNISTHDTVSRNGIGTVLNLLLVHALILPLIILPTAKPVTMFSKIGEKARVRHERCIVESQILGVLHDESLPRQASGRILTSEGETV